VIDIVQARAQALGTAGIDAVETQGNRGIDEVRVAVGADASDIDLAALRGALHLQGGNVPQRAVEMILGPLRDVVSRNRGDGDGNGLHILGALLSRHDNLFEGVCAGAGGGDALCAKPGDTWKTAASAVAAQTFAICLFIETPRPFLMLWASRLPTRAPLPQQPTSRRLCLYKRL
jgi:hypothetical protein